MSGTSSTGQRQPREAVSHIQSPTKLEAERGRAGKRGRPVSKCIASCVVCKKTLCKLGCLGRVNTGQDASSEAGVPCRKSRTGACDQGDDWEVSLALAGGVRGREREMQGPGDSDPGEEQLKPHLMLAVCQLTDVGTVKCRDDDDGQVTRIQERKQLKPRPMLSVSAWRAYI